MDEFFTNSRKRVLPVDSTPNNGETNSQKKKLTPTFVPPLKKALSTPSQCNHHPAAAAATTSPDSQGSIELSFNDTQPDCSSEQQSSSSSPVVCPPPHRSFRRATAASSKHHYTLTKNCGQLNKRLAAQQLPRSMAAAAATTESKQPPPPLLGVFDFPVSQQRNHAATTSTTRDSDQTSTGNLFRLNASITGRSLEQQIATDIEVIAVIERTCAEIKEIREKYSINHQQQQYHGTQNKSNTSSSTSSQRDSSQPYMSLFFSQYEE